MQDLSMMTRNLKAAGKLKEFLGFCWIFCETSKHFFIVTLLGALWCYKQTDELEFYWSNLGLDIEVFNYSFLYMIEKTTSSFLHVSYNTLNVY